MHTHAHIHSHIHSHIYTYINDKAGAGRKKLNIPREACEGSRCIHVELILGLGLCHSPHEAQGPSAFLDTGVKRAEELCAVQEVPWDCIGDTCTHEGLSWRVL